jgi:EAL domain-containing protein (putative c-di-GMP-specific phosphodiesterase class I)
VDRKEDHLSFLTNLTTDMHDPAIVAGMMAVANALGMTVIAEGVDDRDQATPLRGMSCPGAQGWLYSKAVPSDEATPLLDRVYPHS